MIEMKKGSRLIFLQFCFSALWLFFVAATGHAQNIDNKSPVDANMLVQGVVARVVPTKNKVVVKPGKAERINIHVTAKTVFVGILSLQELSKEHRVKVWYDVVGDQHRAVQIERLPDLGC